MNLRNDKNQNGDDVRNAEAGFAILTSTDTFEEGKLTLIRPDRDHHDDLEEHGGDFEREGIEKTQRTSERSDAKTGEERLFKGRPNRRPRAIVGKRNNPL